VVTGTVTCGTTSTFDRYNLHTFLSGTTPFVVNIAITADILVVGGGGGAGNSESGAGGAGGLVYLTSETIASSSTISVIIGPGGGIGTVGINGTNSTVALTGNTITALGGGGGSTTNQTGGPLDGGSGGGKAYGAGAPGEGIQTTDSGITADSRTYGFGNDGGSDCPASEAYGNDRGAGGGGGANQDGFVGTGVKGGNGGSGKDMSSYFGTTRGESGWFAGGGGGGRWSGSSATGGQGGGGDAGITPTSGDPNTGGGGGGKSATNTAGSGGSGIVIIRYLTSSLVVTNDLILQSTDTAAEAVPTKADIVIRMEDTAGTAALNTDIKAYISRDSGVHVTDSWTQATLTDEGDWGDGTQRILVAHDVSLTDKNSGTAMCYKITTHNQSSSKETL